MKEKNLLGLYVDLLNEYYDGVFHLGTRILYYAYRSDDLISYDYYLIDSEHFTYETALAVLIAGYSKVVTMGIITPRSLLDMSYNTFCNYVHWYQKTVYNAQIKPYYEQLGKSYKLGNTVFY